MDASSEDNEQMNSQPSKRKGRSKNFSIQEDMLLIKAWENVSLDPVKVGDQAEMSYWGRIVSYYNEHKKFTSQRSSVALSNRWFTIQKSVSKFQQFYKQVEENNQVGVDESEKVRSTMQMYQSVQGSAFPFLHCWTELRTSPKFASKKSKKGVTASPNDTIHIVGSSQTPVSDDCGIENGEGLERPRGRKTAKIMVRESPNDTVHTVASSQSPVSVDCDIENEEELERPMVTKTAKIMDGEARNKASFAFFTYMKEHMSTTANMRREEYESMMKIEQGHLELKRQQMRINEIREKREQQMYEASIMAIDTTNMESQMASFYSSLKAEILRERR